MCRPRRCLTLEGTARRSAAAAAATTSATGAASTRGGGRGRDRAAASVTAGTVGKTVTTFGPGGESAKARCCWGVSPAWQPVFSRAPSCSFPGCVCNRISSTCFPSLATTTTQPTGGPTTGVTVTATGATITAVSEEKLTMNPNTVIPMSTGAPGTARAATGAAKAAGVSTGGGGAAAGPLVAPHR